MNEGPEDEEQPEKGHSVKECIGDLHNKDKLKRIRNECKYYFNYFSIILIYNDYK